jgi:2-polyprenyl-3-methyl-5-hydroxy-6-metoxy-1,4-benzoquinol methylase
LIDTSPETSTYVIRGGVDGRERLRILARVMQPTTLALLDRGGIRPGMACLDVGCGGGDVSLDLARLTGPGGRVIGIDKDEVVIEIAQLVSELYEFARTPGTVVGVARVVQAWGCRPQQV